MLRKGREQSAPARFMHPVHRAKVPEKSCESITIKLLDPMTAGIVIFP
ncbi:hypothetical protein Z947_3530 [Sulfitobacter geojensis]|nr:hypothetical protein Z947_3530 [Sulfitobacter geojensis]